MCKLNYTCPNMSNEGPLNCPCPNKSNKSSTKNPTNKPKSIKSIYQQTSPWALQSKLKLKAIYISNPITKDKSQKAQANK